MTKKIRPVNLKAQAKKDKLNKNLPKTQKLVKEEGRQIGTLRNISNRNKLLLKELDKIKEDYHTYDKKLTLTEKNNLIRKIRTLFIDLELFARRETNFQENKKDNQLEERSLDRLHLIANLMMNLSISIKNLEKKGILDKNFHKKAIAKNP